MAGPQGRQRAMPGGVMVKQNAAADHSHAAGQSAARCAAEGAGQTVDVPPQPALKVPFHPATV
jgi:hypothetical protein